MQKKSARREGRRWRDSTAATWRASASLKLRIFSLAQPAYAAIQGKSKRTQAKCSCISAGFRNGRDGSDRIHGITTTAGVGPKRAQGDRPGGKDAGVNF